MAIENLFRRSFPFDLRVFLRSIKFWKSSTCLSMSSYFLRRFVSMLLKFPSIAPGGRILRWVFFLAFFFEPGSWVCTTVFYCYLRFSSISSEDSSSEPLVDGAFDSSREPRTVFWLGTCKLVDGIRSEVEAFVASFSLDFWIDSFFVYFILLPSPMTWESCL